MTCTRRLETALGDVPALWDELDIILTRQSRYSEAQGRAGAETAMPFNVNASELGWVLRNTLATWCKLISEERGRELPREDHPAAVAKWLLWHVEWLRHHRAGHEAVEEVTSIVRRIRQAVDRPAPKVYAGPCAECGQDMYAKPDSAMVTCRPCGLEYPVADMVAWMQREARQRLVTAKEAIVLLGRFGIPLQQKTIDTWFQRKRLPDHSDGHGKRLYRFDDVWRLVMGEDAEAS
jgi:hypothetical protein